MHMQLVSVVTKFKSHQYVPKADSPNFPIIRYIVKDGGQLYLRMRMKLKVSEHEFNLLFFF